MPKPPPVAKLDPTCVWSPDMDRQAMTVFAQLPASQREQAFAIYKRNGPQGLAEYCYSVAVQGKGENFEFATDPAAGRLAGLGHTHPDNKDHPDAGTFSPNDVQTAKQLKLPSYIADVASGDVKRFDPNSSKTDRGQGLRAGTTSRGTLVGNLSRREQLAQAYDLHTPATTP